jgi:hypothetical protein
MGKLYVVIETRRMVWEIKRIKIKKFLKERKNILTMRIQFFSK